MYRRCYLLCPTVVLLLYLKLHASGPVVQVVEVLEAVDKRVALGELRLAPQPTVGVSTNNAGEVLRERMGTGQG